LKLGNWLRVVPQPPARYGLADFHFRFHRRKQYAGMDIRLYVGNVSKSTTDAELKTLFEQAGAVTAVELIKERDTGQSKGFGFVTMPDQAEADKAIATFNGYTLEDRELKVSVARPKAERA
jgi:RNA recognition motif-containing protein